MGEIRHLKSILSSLAIIVFSAGTTIFPNSALASKELVVPLSKENDSELINHNCKFSLDVFNELVSQRLYLRLEQIYRNMIEICPKQADLYWALGETLSAQNWLEDAQIAYEEAIQLEPTNANAYRSLGDVYKKAEDYSNAIDTYQIAIQLNSSDVETYVSLSEVFYSIGKKNEAVDVLKTAIDVDPNYARTYLVLGDSFKSDDIFLAIDYYEKSIKADENLVDGFVRLGETHAELENIEKSIHYYQKAADIAQGNSPNFCDPQIYYGLADAYLAQANFLSSEQAYNHVADCLRTIEDVRTLSEIVDSLSAIEYSNILELTSLYSVLGITPNNLTLTLNGSDKTVVINNYSGDIDISISSNSSTESLDSLESLFSFLGDPIPDKSGLRKKYKVKSVIDSIDIEKLEQKIIDSPNVVLDYSILAISYFLKGEIDQSVEILEIAAKINKTEFNKILNKDDSQSQGEEDNAFGQALGQDMLFFILGGYLIAADKKEEVLSILDETYLANNEWGFLAYFFVTYQLRRMGRPLEANKIIQHTYQKYSEQPYLVLARAFVEIDKENYAEAQLLLDTAKKFDPFLVRRDELGADSGEFYDEIAFGYSIVYRYFIYWAQKMIDEPNSLDFSDLFSDTLEPGAIMTDLAYRTIGDAATGLISLTERVDYSQSQVEDFLNQLPYLLSGSINEASNKFSLLSANFLIDLSKTIPDLVIEYAEEHETLRQDYISYINNVEDLLQTSLQLYGLGLILKSDTKGSELSPELLEQISQLDPASSIKIIIGLIPKIQDKKDFEQIRLQLEEVIDKIDATNDKNLRDFLLVFEPAIRNARIFLQTHSNIAGVTEVEQNETLAILDQFHIWIEQAKDAEFGGLDQLLKDTLLEILKLRRYGFGTPPYQETIPATYVAKRNRSVVGILEGDEHSPDGKIGTGFVVSRDNNAVYILTARHVLLEAVGAESIPESSVFRVEFYSQPVDDQQPLRLYADVVDQVVAPELDLVLLKVAGGVPSNIQPFDLAQLEPLMQDSLYVIGHPAQSSWENTQAVFERRESSSPLEGYQISLTGVEIDNSAKEGYSGGPVLNSDNQVIGIMYAAENGFVTVYPTQVIKDYLSGLGVL